MKKIYWVISGEGETGTWERHEATAAGIRKILTRERCGGDRFARAFENFAETKSKEIVGYDVESGAEKIIPTATPKNLEK